MHHYFSVVGVNMVIAVSGLLVSWSGNYIVHSISTAQTHPSINPASPYLPPNLLYQHVSSASTVAMATNLIPLLRKIYEDAWCIWWAHPFGFMFTDVVFFSVNPSDLRITVVFMSFWACYIHTSRYTFIINPCNAELFLYKPWRLKVFFN